MSSVYYRDAYYHCRNQFIHVLTHACAYLVLLCRIMVWYFTELPPLSRISPNYRPYLVSNFAPPSRILRNCGETQFRAFPRITQNIDSPLILILDPSLHTLSVLSKETHPASESPEHKNN